MIQRTDNIREIKPYSDLISSTIINLALWLFKVASEEKYIEATIVL